VYRFLVEKPEGKRPLGRPRRRWEDNTIFNIIPSQHSKNRTTGGVVSTFIFKATCFGLLPSSGQHI
jgi:hypothetical protein